MTSTWPGQNYLPFAPTTGGCVRADNSKNDLSLISTESVHILFAALDGRNPFGSSISVLKLVWPQPALLIWSPVVQCFFFLAFRSVTQKNTSWLYLYTYRVNQQPFPGSPLDKQSLSQREMAKVLKRKPFCTLKSSARALLLLQWKL